MKRTGHSSFTGQSSNPVRWWLAPWRITHSPLSCCPYVSAEPVLGPGAGARWHPRGTEVRRCTHTEWGVLPTPRYHGATEAERSRRWDRRGHDGSPGRKRLRMHFCFCLFPIFRSLLKFSVLSFICLIKECIFISRPVYDNLW